MKKQLVLVTDCDLVVQNMLQTEYTKVEYYPEDKENELLK